MPQQADNPFLAPGAMSWPDTALRRTPSWGPWLLSTVVVEVLLTLTTISLDAQDVIGDSGQATFLINGILWFLLTVVVALRYPFGAACGLSLVLGLIGWITMISVAGIAVPAILSGRIGQRVFGYLSMSYLAGLALVPLVALPLSKLAPPSRTMTGQS